jgi:integrase
MPRARIPWPPEIPHRLKNALTPFTPTVNGWVRWYRGDSRHVCGKSTPLELVEDRWREKKAEVDAELDGEAKRIRNGVTVEGGAAAYYGWLDHRVATGQPKPLEPTTAADYKRTINHFGKCVGPDTPMDDLAQPHFTAFAKMFDGQAPSTLARNVANVHAYLQFCVDEGFLKKMPALGRYFVKPNRQHRRDHRMSRVKAYTPDEIRTLVEHATTEERAWIGLGLCSLDNSDLAHLTHDVVDRKAGVIDYRRRKTGKVRRVIPIPEKAWKWLDAYARVRPEPADSAHADLVFLTPTGLPLQRVKPSKRTGMENPIDYVAMRWVRLLIRAGLREKMPSRRRKADRELPRRKKGEGGGDNRGFRGLRTTFSNYAPPGFRDEVEIIMGHANGTVLVEDYIEDYGVDRLLERSREVLAEVWKVALSASGRGGEAPGRKRGTRGGGGQKGTRPKGGRRSGGATSARRRTAA